MGNKKGTKPYSEELKLRVRLEHEQGASLHSLCRKYGMSYYSAESWCGLRPEVNRRQALPRKKGRPTNKPEELEAKVRRLEMENELLRNFLEELERK